MPCAGLDPTRVFYLACREAVRADRIEADARFALHRLQLEFAIPTSRALALFGLAARRRRRRGGRRPGEMFRPGRLLATMQRVATGPGGLAADDARVLQRVARLLERSKPVVRRPAALLAPTPDPETAPEAVRLDPPAPAASRRGPGSGPPGSGRPPQGSRSRASGMPGLGDPFPLPPPRRKPGSDRSPERILEEFGRLAELGLVTLLGLLALLAVVF